MTDAGLRMFRTLVALWLVLVASLGVAVAATPGPAVPRIGYLVLSPLTDPPSPERAGFLQGLRDFGYEDGKNIVIEYRSAQGDAEALPFLAQELVDLGVKAIVGLGFPVIDAARKASGDIPIVMLLAADPVDLGFVHSLAHPGENITGMALMSAELGPKRLQLLKTALPAVKTVGVVWDSANPGMPPKWNAIESVAPGLGMRLVAIDLASIRHVDGLRARLVSARVDAVMTIVSPGVAAYRQSLPRIALELRLPTMFDWDALVEQGGLMSYVPSFPKVARRAAAFVDKILKGATPAELPVEQPTEIHLTVNLKTARALGVRLSEAVLLRADRLIE